MDTESKGLLLKHIRSGQDVPDIFIDVKTMLGNAGTGLYAKPCCDRIVAAGLVDGAHVVHDCPTPWNLSMDAYGMRACKEILGAYIHTDSLNPIYEAFWAYHDWVVSTNNILYSLRKMGAKDLREGRQDALGYRVNPDEAEDISELLRAELESRRLPARIRQTAARAAFTCQILLRFRGPMRASIPLARMAWLSWEENGNSPCLEGNGVYSKALRRFLDAHGGNSGIGRLRGDELKRYVYLAVKAYGKERDAGARHSRVKPCRETEHRYRELKRLMEAVGRLTPQDLLHMYPVTKEYDGERWGSKDYFSTVEKLGSMPPDKPIGDGQDVACLLWDYQNWDLEFLLMEWMGVLGDLHIYCNDRGPNDQFHERLMGRHGSTETA